MTDPAPMETDAAGDATGPQFSLEGITLNIAGANDKVYKDECLYCFNSPFSTGGLLISTKSFFAVCPRHAPTFIEKDNNKGFVSYKKSKILAESDEPKDKIQKLSIKFEHADEIEEYNFVVFPNVQQQYSINGSTLPLQVYESARSIVNHTSAYLQERLEAGVSEWDGEQRFNSEAAENLVQQNSGKQIPYTGWACEEPDCGLKENLWLNLTDGAIMCGRPQVLHGKDGTTVLPGNGHAKLHYERTHFPIAVKLGTIANGDADIYDYIVDDAVKDPKLAEHLRHFGLDIEKMEKTEKSTLEMELDLNQKWEWSRCLEDGVSLESVFGPSFSGIINIGSSCYINSVLQMLFVIPEVRKVYADGAGWSLLNKPPLNQINEDFNAQFAKVMLALESGDYSKEGQEEVGFKPTQFRKIVGRGHPEFSTARQQDAEEYMRYLLDTVDNKIVGDTNPVDPLRFQIETRLVDSSSGYVRYSDREDVILPLQIPIEQAEDVAGGPTQRKVIALTTILDYVFGEEVIEGFQSPVTGKKGEAVTRIRMKTFPDFLIMQVKRFGYSADHTIKKLDVDVLLDEQIDLEKYVGKGPQPDESLLPDDVNADIGPRVNEDHVEQLVNMGFSQNAVRKALHISKNNLEAATEWIMVHMDDADFNEVHPDLRGSRTSENKDDPRIQELTVLGFPPHKARVALKQNGGDVNAAAEWLFLNGHTLPDDEIPEPDSNEKAKKECHNGHGRYKLRGIISHMGSSPYSGHYVAHIERDGKWYLFNDEKVAISQNPPVSLGYLYLLERIPSN